MGGVRCSGLIRYSVNKYLLQLYKVRRPETCDLRSPKSVNAENKETVMTNGIPSSDCRESLGVAARVRARCDIIEAR